MQKRKKMYIYIYYSSAIIFSGDFRHRPPISYISDIGFVYLLPIGKKSIISLKYQKKSV